MTEFIKNIAKIAESRKSRDTLNRWPIFQLPEPDDQIEVLMERLSEKEVIASNAESEENPFRS